MRTIEFFLDGKFIKTSEALLDAFTPGQIKAKGVFETIRVDRGNIEFLEEHLKRLLKGLKALKVGHAFTAVSLKRIARLVVKKNSFNKTGRLRIVVFQEKKHTHAAVMVLPYQAPDKPLRLTMTKTSRPANARHADLKSLDYQIFAQALEKARAAGFDDALLLNAKGHVFESTRANVFIVSGDQLMTPPLSSGCLNGIIRQKIIKDLKVKEQNITPAMLKKAQVIFLTNSMMGIMKSHFHPCPPA